MRGRLQQGVLAAVYLAAVIIGLLDLFVWRP